MTVTKRLCKTKCYFRAEDVLESVFDADSVTVVGVKVESRQCSQYADILSPCDLKCPVGDPGIAEKEDADSVFMEMICPAGTNPDDSPLYVLCCNDTCSFTWTGAEHINQVSSHGGGKCLKAKNKLLRQPIK